MLRTIAAAALLCAPALAIEIATGAMLGDGHDKRAFYIREGRGGWRKTYTGSGYRPEAAGRLMNLRIAQALFHDEWMTERPFHPGRHTDRVIRALDGYRAHGIMAITVSLQGGNMAYEREGGIKRTRSYKLGPEKGAHVSAFRPDGSLKPEWMKRCLKLARELDRRGMILNLAYLYAHQDELFESTAAIERAVTAATDWLIDNNVRNVIIEIANEVDNAAWDHDRYVPQSTDKLIEIERSRFKAKNAPFRLPVTASSQRLAFLPVQRNADLTATHGNHLSPADKQRMVRALAENQDVPGPVYINEDDNGRESTLAHLAAELASCDAVWSAGGSWGYMPWVQLQIWPFRTVEPGTRSQVSDDMPVAERDAAYFKAVLEHIRELVFVNDASGRRSRIQ
jgi:hypothetical protein